MGSSRGLNRVRAARSHSMRKVAPPKTEAGSRRLWLGPVIMRTIWGVTRPTKPMVPPMDTHTPIRADTAMSTVSRTFFTLTPTWRALSSPTAKAFSSRARRRMTPPQTMRAIKSTRALR